MYLRFAMARVYHAPIVQWIGHSPPKAEISVRIRVGALVEAGGADVVQAPIAATPHVADALVAVHRPLAAMADIVATAAADRWLLLLGFRLYAQGIVEAASKASTSVGCDVGHA